MTIFMNFLRLFYQMTKQKAKLRHERRAFNLAFSQIFRFVSSSDSFRQKQTDPGIILSLSGLSFTPVKATFT
jgi:hypothetical protein